MRRHGLGTRIGRTLAALVLLLLLCACARSPQSQFYTLSTVQPAADLCPPDGPIHRIKLVLWHFPALLERPQIATRFQPNFIEYAEFHRWAGSLREEFLQTLEENLRRQCQRLQVQPDFWPEVAQTTRLNLDLRRFDGSLGGEVHLSLNWMITGEQAEAAGVERHSEIIEPVNENSYAGLVAAQSRALTNLAAEIIRALLAPR
jgi:uncharacterized lipoprotein YmbA